MPRANVHSQAVILVIFLLLFHGPSSSSFLPNVLPLFLLFFFLLLLLPCCTIRRRQRRRPQTGTKRPDAAAKHKSLSALSLSLSLLLSHPPTLFVYFILTPNHRIVTSRFVSLILSQNIRDSILKVHFLQCIGITLN